MHSITMREFRLIVYYRNLNCSFSLWFIFISQASMLLRSRYMGTWGDVDAAAAVIVKTYCLTHYTSRSLFRCCLNSFSICESVCHSIGHQKENAFEKNPIKILSEWTAAEPREIKDRIAHKRSTFLWLESLIPATDCASSS